MKKSLAVVISGFIISIFLFSVYQSKKEYYKADKAFYDNANFSGEVVQIKTGRGTKIFYSDSEFFYESSLVNDSIAEIIKIGDVFRKHDSVLELFREDAGKEMKRVATVKVKNPGDSYFRYSLGL